MSPQAFADAPRARTINAPDSGIFRVGAHPAFEGTEGTIAKELREIVTEFAVLLMPSCGRGVRVILGTAADAHDRARDEACDRGCDGDDPCARTEAPEGSGSASSFARVADAMMHPAEPDDLGFPVALRLGAWLAEPCRTHCAAILPVPAYVRAWVRSPRAFVVPMGTLQWCAGAIVTPVAGLTAASSRQLRKLAADLALAVEADDFRISRETYGR